jgi:hypothetical protein
VTTYALVPGAWHSAWHWQWLVTELTRRGHRAIAVDLPCEDPSAGAVEYAAVVDAALSGVDGAVVLVAHSLGGLTAPVVAAGREVSRLVLLAALLPSPGRSLDEQAQAFPGAPRMLVRGLGSGQAHHDDGSTSWRPGAAGPVLYPDAPAVLAAEAAARLRRQYWRVSRERTPLPRWPDVPTEYVVCAGDRVVNPEWSRWAAPELAGVVPREIPGDHSPFLSRPAELADLLT